MKTPRVLLLPHIIYVNGRSRVEMLRDVIRAAGAVPISPESGVGLELPLTLLASEIEKSDLLVVDIDNGGADSIYAIGYAHAKRKPIIVLSESERIGWTSLAELQMLHYSNRFNKYSELEGQFTQHLNSALANPERYLLGAKVDSRLRSVFISYCHKDKAYLDRVLVHLKPLVRLGIIDVWSDERIAPGDLWKLEIEKALAKSRAAILLVSADFLASDFIANNELPPLLAQSESNGTKIIPIVIRPCRFSRDKNLNAFQSLNPPSDPISEMKESEQERQYDRLSQVIEILGIGESEA